MDYLQYFISSLLYCVKSISRVLNLIINGLPSILLAKFSLAVKVFIRFKPYYKWITFNTISKIFTCS